MDLSPALERDLDQLADVLARAAAAWWREHGADASGQIDIGGKHALRRAQVSRSGALNPTDLPTAA